MALGARQGDVLMYVLRNATSMLLVGFAVGLAGAFALTRLLKSLLFNVSTLDPIALSIACISMALVGICSQHGFRRTARRGSILRWRFATNRLIRVVPVLSAPT